MPDTQKRRKVSDQPDSLTAAPMQTQGSFFNTSLRTQPFQPQSNQTQAQLSCPPELLLLLAALVEELRTHNAIEAIKLQREDKQKEAEQQTAINAETADKERFEKCSMMYT